MWVLSLVYLLLCILLRAYYIDYEGVAQIAAVAEGIRRDSVNFWSGWGPLGMLLFWLATKPLSLVMPLVDSAQVIGAVAIWLSGLLLYRTFRSLGLAERLSGWLVFFFYGANVSWNGATMLAFPALCLLLMALWALSAVRLLSVREVPADSALRLGVLGGLLCGVNLMALAPTIAGGILGWRRGVGVGYFGALLGVVLVIYLATYFVVLPAQVVAGGVERPKPSLVEWVLSGDAPSQIDYPRWSALYWRALGEQLQNSLLALGRPFRVRDVYQYFLGGTFITLLKGAFLAMLLIFVIVLGAIQFGSERIATERLVASIRQLGGYAFGISLVLIVLWQGDRQALYLWTLYWALFGLGGWLASFFEGDIQRLGYALPPLVLIMLTFGLMKTAELRSTEHDGERQEAQAVSAGIREGDTLVAATRLAEWLRYESGGKARVIATEYWLRPESDFRQLIEKASAANQRVIVWDYALRPELFQSATGRQRSPWLESLQKAQKIANRRGGAYLRRYANMVVYPTLTLWGGEVVTFGATGR